MSRKLTLSVLDQSPVRSDGTAAQALRETIELAAACERFGYKRFWVSEHHNLPNFAGTSPEILIGQIAARTSRIQVGSGGVMLSHYSPLKVAENFRILESLYPGRINLGVGRAPGSDQLTAYALVFPHQPAGVEQFPRQVKDLIGYLNGELDEGHPFTAVHAGPKEPESAPEVWLLGSRYESAFMAAQMGLPFAYAHFFATGAQDGPEIVTGYRENFKPSRFLAAPKVNVGVHVVCAETGEEARRLAASRNLGRLLNVQGRAHGIPPVEEALLYPYRPEELAYLERYRQGCVDGDPAQVKAGLEAVAERYDASDLTVVTICHNFAARVRSYQLVAEAFGIGGE